MTRRPHRLTEAEYNRFCEIEDRAAVLVEFLLDADPKQVDWTDRPTDPDAALLKDRALMAAIILKRKLEAN